MDELDFLEKSPQKGWESLEKEFELFRKGPS
jgi:hypothetical protein